MRKVDLSNIEKMKYGDKYRYKWGKSIGKEVSFIYDDITGSFTVLDYFNENSNFYIKIDYNGTEKIINPRYVYDCHIESIFKDDDGQIWKYEIGDHLKDAKRDLTIINRQYRKVIYKDNKIHKGKQYQYKCNVCGFDSSSIDLWVFETHMKTGGCACCGHVKIITGINDIGTTAPETLHYYIDKYFPLTHSMFSMVKTDIKCPNCGFVKKLSPAVLNTQGMSCPRCSDGVSYPEKFVMNIFDQANIQYLYQVGKSTFDWIEGKSQYDFYLKNNNWIVETHGMQHYSYLADRKYNSHNYTQEEADQMKEDLALDNNIDKYVVIDCMQSNRKYIEKNLRNSILSNIIDFDEIDWMKADIFASGSLFLKICEEYKRATDNNEIINASILSDKYKVSVTTIYNYLKKGNKLGLCVYDGKHKINQASCQTTCIPIIIIYQGEKIAFCSYNKFQKWLKFNNITYDRSLIVKYKDTDYIHNGIKVYSCTKKEFNKMYDDPFIQTFGEKFHEYYIQKELSA